MDLRMMEVRIMEVRARSRRPAQLFAKGKYDSTRPLFEGMLELRLRLRPGENEKKSRGGPNHREGTIVIVASHTKVWNVETE